MQAHAHAASPAMQGALSPMPSMHAVEPAMPTPQPAASTSGGGGARPPASKRITTHAELRRFLDSDSARSFFAFVLSLNEAVSGKKASDACAVSPPVQVLLDLLASLSAAVDEIPPVSQSLRYGNPAYRTWFARMVEGCVPGLQRLLPPGTRPDAVQELAPYWADSFGNATRIDYGTGHETNFAALLYCLARLGVLQVCASRRRGPRTCQHMSDTPVLGVNRL
jgi:serine/threonine-protein phosphatase 2A activator